MGDCKHYWWVMCQGLNLLVSSVSNVKLICDLWVNTNFFVSRVSKLTWFMCHCKLHWWLMYQCLLVGFYFYVSYVIFIGESCITVNFTDGLCVNVIFTGEFCFKCKLCLCYMSNENFIIELCCKCYLYWWVMCHYKPYWWVMCQILSLLERYVSYVIFTGESCVIVEFTGERCITKLQYINKYKDILSTWSINLGFNYMWDLQFFHFYWYVYI
jgi:hypothetical protein